MKVSDFQKYLRALAEAIATKTPAKELTDAADALGPFAHYKMEAFAEFLKAAEAKYGQSRELPDGKPPKPEPAPRKPPKEKTPKTQAPTVEDLLSAVAALKVRLRTDQTLTKEGVAGELERFMKLGKEELFRVVEALGVQVKQKTMKGALATIVNHTVSAQGGVERSDA